MFDNKKIIDKNDRFRVALRKNILEVSGKKKTEVDVIRTAIWFAAVKDRLSANTAYEIEKKLEPDAFGRNKDGDPFHRNKWNKYEAGQVTPDSRTINSVDTQLPGTKELLNHVLWECLSSKPDLSFPELLKALKPDIQKIVFQTSSYESQQRTIITSTHLRMLERRAGLDSLACLTILCREACGLHRQKEAFRIGESLYRVLLMACTNFPISNFSSELFYLFKRLVFSRILYNETGFVFESFDFSKQVNFLLRSFLKVEDNYSIGSKPEDFLKVQIDLMNGVYGDEIMLKLRPPFGFVSHRST